jgi:hypothetical protein
MSNRPRTFALVLAAALLPAAAQAHWYDPCGCQRAPVYRYHHAYYHYRHYVPRERGYLAVELAPNVFAVPYRLRHYPYVGGGYRGLVGTTDIVREPAIIGSEGGEQRTIDADAKVTIIGPNRMDIRLYRKGGGAIVNPER